MGSTSDKAAGVANDAIGNLKQGIGKLVGSEKLQAEGMAQEAKGEAQKAAGDVKSTVRDAANTLAAKANRNL